MQSNTPLWIGRIATVNNPRDAHFGDLGVVVTDPSRDCIFLRWPDGTHSEHGIGTVRMPRVLPDAPPDIEPTDDLDSEMSDGGAA